MIESLNSLIRSILFLRINQMDFFGDTDNYHEYDWMFEAQRKLKPGNQILKSTQTEHSVWISNLTFAEDQKILKEKQIGAVLSAFEISQLIFKYKRLEITHLMLPLEDIQNQDLTKYFDIAYNFIQENRKKTNVLVHCAAGVSRSVSLVISYMMRKYGMTFQRALMEVRGQRPKASPNRGFQKQLRAYEQVLQSQNQDQTQLPKQIEFQLPKQQINSGELDNKPQAIDKLVGDYSDLNIPF